MREVKTSKCLLIDRSKARLPSDHTLYKVCATYGLNREFPTYVSAKSIRDARKVFVVHYSCAHKAFKIKSIQIESEDHEKWHDLKQRGIIGDMDVKTVFYRQAYTETEIDEREEK